MPEPIRKESPLVERRLDLGPAAGEQYGDVALFERPFLGHINLRGEPDSASFRAAAVSALGAGVPMDPNTFVEVNGARICWLGPDEWLILCQAERKERVLAGLQGALRGVFSAVTEVSSGQTVIAVDGPRAADVLAQGCPLDLHPRAFGPGRCAQSYLGRVGVLVMQTSAAPTFELVVRRSFADHLYGWLQHACANTEPGRGH